MKSVIVGLSLSLAAFAGAAEAPKPKLDLWVEGEARFRPEVRTNADLDEFKDDTRTPVLSRLRLLVGAKAADRARFVFQIQDARAFGDEASTASNEKNLDLHQGYVDLYDVLGKGSTLSFGRQEWIYGDERMIGAFGWNNVGRAFDGARARLPVAHGTLDFLAARLSQRIGTDAKETNQDLLGAYYSRKWQETNVAEAYTLAYRDSLHRPGEIAGASGDSLVAAIGGRVKLRHGPIDGGAEAVVERGSWNGDDLAAFAFGGSLGASFGKTPVVRPFAGFDYATGDHNGGDGKREEFFNFFPTNHIHYGDMDLFGWRNIVSPYVGVEVKDGPRKFLTRVHHFALDEARGAWKDAVGTVLGVDPTGASGKNVGNEWDIQFWTPVQRDFKLLLGYGHFWPGAFAKATRGDDAQNFAYAQLSYAFRWDEGH